TRDRRRTGVCAIDADKRRSRWTWIDRPGAAMARAFRENRASLGFGSVPVVGEEVGPGATRRAVPLLDVAEAPGDLRPGVGAPVASVAGPLVRGQRLGDAVGARPAVAGPVVPPALAGPELHETPELRAVPAALADHLLGDGLVPAARALLALLAGRAGRAGRAARTGLGALRLRGRGAARDHERGAHDQGAGTAEHGHAGSLSMDALDRHTLPNLRPLLLLDAGNPDRQ